MHLTFQKRLSHSVSTIWVILFNTINTSNQISFQIPRFREQCVTRRTPERFEQCVDVVDVANMIVVA